MRMLSFAFVLLAPWLASAQMFSAAEVQTHKARKTKAKDNILHGGLSQDETLIPRS